MFFIVQIETENGIKELVAGSAAVLQVSWLIIHPKH